MSSALHPSCRVRTLLNVLAITGALYQGVTTLLSGTFRAGVTYTASVYMYGVSGGEQVLLDIGAAPTESPDGAVDFSEQAITLTTGWTRYSVTWTPRVNQPVARLILRSATATVMTFRVDGALVTPGSVAQRTSTVTRRDAVGLVPPATAPPPVL